MAQITGSTTTDWSDVPLAQVDFEGDVLKFVNRVDQILNQLNPGDATLVSASPTLVVFDLFSGGRLTIGGSGFDTDNNQVINSFNFSNTGTGEIIRWTGTADGIGNDFVTSATIGSTGFSETFRGTIIVPSTFPPVGNLSGTLTSLIVKTGSTTETFSGNFHLAGDNVSVSLTGTVTGIAIVSGADKITMTGLSLSLDVLQAALGSSELDTVGDFFAFLSNHLPGNDTITYTNNSGIGMTFFGGAGNDTITINGPNGDTLNGGDGNDILLGGLGQDTVNGETGDDRITTLVSTGNVDTIDAGAGNDTLVLSGIVPGDHVVVVDLSSGIDQIVSIGGVADPLTQINFENVNAVAIGSSATIIGNDGDNTIIGSNGNDVLHGGAGTDQLSGGVGNDSLDGGAGNDAMSGGLGNDTYIVDSIGDTVTEGLNAGADKVFSSIDHALAPNVEQLELTGSANLNGTGNTLNNRLTGNSGVNILTGGVGNDTYIVQNDADSVVENLNAGTDVVQSSAANFTLGTNVEHLTLIGSADITGTGNSLNNIITGNSGINQLSGLAGNDQLIGGEGDDTLLGGLGNDILLGGTGADHLDGGTGTDSMAGGVGNDTYTVDVATDVVTEALNAGTDTVVTALTYTLGANVENLTLTGSANVNGTGNTLANVLTGNDGNNILNGGVGNDTLLGGDGNDTYVIGLGTDVLTENLNGGTDTVQSAITHTLGANFEQLTLTGVGAINGTGNELANVLTGNAAANVLAGEAGNDTLLGGAGNDTYIFGSGDGQDLLQDNSGSADKILFEGGINPLDLVISRQANDLRLAIHGSADQVTVQNWFTSPVNQTETIQAGNGQTLLSTQVDQLIQAMAGFTQQTGLSWDAAIAGGGNAQQQADFQNILAANWQS